MRSSVFFAGALTLIGILHSVVAGAADPDNWQSHGNSSLARAHVHDNYEIDASLWFVFVGDLTYHKGDTWHCDMRDAVGYNTATKKPIDLAQQTCLCTALADHFPGSGKTLPPGATGAVHCVQTFKLWGHPFGQEQDNQNWMTLSWRGEIDNMYCVDKIESCNGTGRGWRRIVDPHGSCPVA